MAAEVKMAAAAILDFEKLLPMHCHLTDLNQTWWDCCDSVIERNCNILKVHNKLILK